MHAYAQEYVLVDCFAYFEFESIWRNNRISSELKIMEKQWKNPFGSKHALTIQPQRVR